MGGGKVFWQAVLKETKELQRLKLILQKENYPFFFFYLNHEMDCKTA